MDLEDWAGLRAESGVGPGGQLGARGCTEGRSLHVGGWGWASAGKAPHLEKQEHREIRGWCLVGTSSLLVLESSVQFVYFKSKFLYCPVSKHLIRTSTTPKPGSFSISGESLTHSMAPDRLPAVLSDRGQQSERQDVPSRPLLWDETPQAL